MISTLMLYLSDQDGHPSRGTAYWGLAALHDRQQLEMLRRLLELEVDRDQVDEGVLHQILICLEKIGEEIRDAAWGGPMGAAGK